MTYTVAEGVTNSDVFSAENVVKKRLTFPVGQMSQEAEAFLDEVASQGLHPKGSLFYSLNNVPYDEMVDIEFFLPIQETEIGQGGLAFSSYFEMNNTILTVVDHDYNTLAEEAYAKLLWTLDVNHQEVNTPFYHVISQEDPRRITIFLGYAY
ncbi:DUF5085 family protein [Streptococcus chenjunshii]|uniref:DUF5085 family protein n=1 Tax=Streptococcus chenjunshii TaxID=2173853 RepID=A0A372KIR1_9STRE|nr:DUF5085 family protein [Streptococcus chenjunshii]AXQ79537.1 DUF5085 family protein [Streptococcus chenjunshii]RFU49990.1 DUF5085 family protein [Streptococcus chenjunshii]RFU52182.1 DUF5085 family protein [Streptococcus chenjunshii]